MKDKREKYTYNRTDAAAADANAGFTLIELVVSITIILFVMLSVGLFIAAGTGQYTKAKADVNTQIESQIALNQLRDIIMEASAISSRLEISGCTVYPVIGADGGRSLLILDRQSSRLLIYSQSSSQTPVTQAAINEAVTDYRDYMIAQDISSLTINQENPSQPLVSISMDFKSGKQTGSISGTYRMRNFTIEE
jgi:prepilin-type N-terminal cleavage/methylation domain-containing protein